MTHAHMTAYGIFAARPEAENGVDALIKAGFRTEDISVLAADRDAADEPFLKQNEVSETEAAEAAESGTVTSTVAGVFGLLAGIGAIAVPEAGTFIAAGPIMGGLAGAATGSSAGGDMAAGGISGALAGAGIPDEDAKRYEERVKQKAILVSVRCDDGEWMRQAKSILEGSRAEDAGSVGEAPAEDEGEKKAG
jgi:hypothetical protein